MPELIMVHCDRYRCKLLLATCITKYQQGLNANPGVKGSECAGCEQGRKRAGLGQVASGGEDDLTSVNEGSLRMQKPDQAPVITLTTAPTHRNIALDSGLPICPNCGEEFEPNPFTTTEQIYCSRRCGKQAWAKVHRPGKSAKKRMNMARTASTSTTDTATKVATDSENDATKGAITATTTAPAATETAAAPSVSATQHATPATGKRKYTKHADKVAEGQLLNKTSQMARRIVELQRENEGLQKQVQELMGDRERLASEREDLTEYALRLAGTIAKEQSKSYDYEKENTRLKEQSDMLVAQLTEERLTLEEENGKLQRRVERLNGDTDGLRVENDRLTAALAEQTEQLHTKANFWKNRCREVRDLLGVPLDTPDNEIADAMITKLTELNDIANQAKASIPKELRLVQPADKLPPVDALPIGYVAKAIMYVLTEFPNLRLLPTYAPGDVCGGSSAGGGKGNGDPGRQVN